MLAKVDNKLLDNIINDSIKLIQFIDLIVFQVEEKKNRKANFGFRGVESWLRNVSTTHTFQQFLERQIDKLRTYLFSK